VQIINSKSAVAANKQTMKPDLNILQTIIQVPLIHETKQIPAYYFSHALRKPEFLVSNLWLFLIDDVSVNVRGTMDLCCCIDGAVLKVLY